MKFQEAKLESVFAEYKDKTLQFEIQRDDLLHPIVSGNKWRKLTGWYEQFTLFNADIKKKTILSSAESNSFKQNNPLQLGLESTNSAFEGILTYGGAYSNHLIATAGFGESVGIKTIGIVRGDEGFTNHYLEFCSNSGMELHFVSRIDYRDKQRCADSVLNGRNFLVIPEGGAGFYGLTGFETVVNGWETEPDYVVHASATGTTALGLSAALLNRGWSSRVKAVLVLKNLEEQLQLWNQFPELSSLIDPVLGYEFGGYAKYSEPLIEFVKWSNAHLGFPVDPVYVGKALYALWDQPEWNDGNSIFLHTGGQWGKDSDKFKSIL
jgi:1-aminocyclopropane-1-carboxylate deaminase